MMIYICMSSKSSHQLIQKSSCYFSEYNGALIIDLTNGPWYLPCFARAARSLLALIRWGRGPLGQDTSCFPRHHYSSGAVRGILPKIPTVSHILWFIFPVLFFLLANFLLLTKPLFLSFFVFFFSSAIPKGFIALNCQRKNITL